ncbi:MAG TPA: hypothetical protein VGO50_17645 [Pyrinomonadaceae bacterium]|nr:hypothetical protein [Pyrinomonadaceae bacterium]
MLLHFPAAAQEKEATEADNPSGPGISRKTDEFGQFGECQRSARLDNFLVELMHEPEARGYIIFYLGKDALPLEREVRGTQLYLDYLKFRKFDESRITLMTAYREKETTELWIVPPGGEIPHPSDTLETPTLPVAETYLFDRKYLGPSEEWGGETFELQSVIDEREREIRESNSEQEEFATESEPVIEPVEPPALEAAEEEIPAPEETFYWLSSSFIDKVKADQDNKGIIIFYLDEETYDLQKVRAHIERAIEKTSLEQKTEAGRFER